MIQVHNDGDRKLRHFMIVLCKLDLPYINFSDGSIVGHYMSATGYTSHRYWKKQ